MKYFFALNFLFLIAFVIASFFISVNWLFVAFFIPVISTDVFVLVWQKWMHQ